MEVKNSENVQEKDYLIMDQDTGELFRTDAQTLNRAQERINELLNNRGHFTLMELYEIITKDWPEDKKQEFFERLNSYEGWKLNEKYANEDLEKLDLDWSSIDDEQLLLTRKDFAFEQKDKTD